MGEEYKMEQIKKALKHWEKIGHGVNNTYCPACKSQGHTLIVHSDETYITGICMKCACAARIARTKPAADKKSD